MDQHIPTTELFDEGNRHDDPLDAIYALNIGDFVADSFISDDLLNKISNRLADDPSKLKAQLEELIQIYSIDKTLSVMGLDAQDGFIIYNSLCATLRQMFQVDACHLFQVAQKESGEQYLSLTGTSKKVQSAQRWDIGISLKSINLFCDVFNQYATQVVGDVKKLPSWNPLDRLEQEKVVSLMATPLQLRHKPIGVLVFESYQPFEFTDELVQLAEVTAKLFVTSIHLQQLVAEAQDQVSQDPLDCNTLLNLRAQVTESIADLGINQQMFLEALSAAVDARHHFTKGHSQQVACFAQAIAEEMELNEKTVDLVYLAGLLGSLGKVDIPSELINKKDQLSPSEWEQLKDHPNVGVSLLVKINFLSEVIPYVHSQSERWDGSGSPEGLKGRSIPLGARILAVASAYFAMTQERPYRGDPLSHKEALKTLQKEADVKWDPAVVEALARMSLPS